MTMERPLIKRFPVLIMVMMRTCSAILDVFDAFSAQERRLVFEISCKTKWLIGVLELLKKLLKIIAVVDEDLKHVSNTLSLKR